MCKHVVHSVAGGGQQRIPQGNGDGSVDVSDVVEVQIHQCGFVGGWYNLTSIKGLIFQKFFLLPIQGVSFRVGDVFLSGKEKSDAATAWVCNDLHRLQAEIRYNKLRK